LRTNFDLYQICYSITVWLVNLFNGLFYAIGGWGTDLANWLKTPGVLHFLTVVVQIVAMIIFFLVNLLIILWIERKLYARLQDRRGIQLPVIPGRKIGTGFFQNLADGLKLLIKETIVPKAADKWMFHVSIVILVSSTLVIFAAFPFSDTFFVANLDLGILFLMAAFSLAPMAIVIGGWAANNKYTLIGGMRSAAMMISYEIPMLLCIVGIVVLSGTLNPVEMVGAQQSEMVFGLQSWYFIPQILGLIIFVIAVIAELERLPFDLPEAEGELVEGWTTEYGGIRYGFVFMTKWLRGFAAAALVALFYFGGWSGPILPQELWFLIKTWIIFAFFVFIAWSFPRVRTDQILDLGWRILIPLAILNIFIAVALKMLGWF
jgi:NADH-quinone oxidoreductase subunit H